MGYRSRITKPVDSLQFGHGAIIAPLELREDFDETKSAKVLIKLQRRKADPNKKTPQTFAPELPVLGAGQDGKLGTSNKAQLMKSLLKDEGEERDPREAFLRHAKAAEESPHWITPAYKNAESNAKK